MNIAFTCEKIELRYDRYYTYSVWDNSYYKCTLSCRIELEDKSFDVIYIANYFLDPRKRIPKKLTYKKWIIKTPYLYGENEKEIKKIRRTAKKVLLHTLDSLEENELKTFELEHTPIVKKAWIKKSDSTYAIDFLLKNGKYRYRAIIKERTDEQMLHCNIYKITKDSETKRLRPVRHSAFKSAYYYDHLVRQAVDILRFHSKYRIRLLFLKDPFFSKDFEPITYPYQKMKITHVEEKDEH